MVGSLAKITTSNPDKSAVVHGPYESQAFEAMGTPVYHAILSSSVKLWARQGKMKIADFGFFIDTVGFVDTRNAHTAQAFYMAIIKSFLVSTPCGMSRDASVFWCGWK